MLKFKMMRDVSGQIVGVNPDNVLYIRELVIDGEPATKIVFSGDQDGYVYGDANHLDVRLGIEEALEVLSS